MVANEGLEKAESSPQPRTATVPSEGGYTDRDFFLCQGALSALPQRMVTFILGLRATIQHFSCALGHPDSAVF